MKFGVQIPQEGCNVADVLAHARAAESLGYDSVFIPDHLINVALPPGTPVYESWTVTCAVLLATARVRGGPLVASEAFRNPALLANAAATLNEATGGRVILGLGAGWYEAEYRAYGFDWRSGGERVARLDEALCVMRAMWDGAPFEGKHYSASGSQDVPRARPTIWVGGVGPRLLEVAARHADAWNAPVLSPDEVAARAAWLRERRPDIEITYEGPVWIDEDAERVARRVERNARSENPIARRYAEVAIAGTPEQVRARVQEYADAGVTHLVCHFGRTQDVRGTELFARAVMPAFR